MCYIKFKYKIKRWFLYSESNIPSGNKSKQNRRDERRKYQKTQFCWLRSIETKTAMLYIYKVKKLKMYMQVEYLCNSTSIAIIMIITAK
jgi:hypothetical protein